MLAREWVVRAVNCVRIGQKCREHVVANRRLARQYRRGARHAEDESDDDVAAHDAARVKRSGRARLRVRLSRSGGDSWT